VMLTWSVVLRFGSVGGHPELASRQHPGRRTTLKIHDGRDNLAALDALAGVDVVLRCAELGRHLVLLSGRTRSEGECAGRPSHHCSAIKVPGHNRVERRLLLLPYDYVEHRALFRTTGEVRFAVPSDGDWASCRVAAVQHRIVSAWRSHPHRMTLRAMSRRFGVSEATLSRVSVGSRWMGDLCAVAFIYGVRRDLDQTKDR